MTRIELWELLLQRASELRDGCLREWRQAREDVQRLNQHGQRLQELSRDYSQQQGHAQAQVHQIRETAELRHTMSQVLLLRQRTDLRLQAALAHEAQCRARLQRAEAEVVKARTLSERAQREQRAQEVVAQQRRDDAAAVAGWLRARTDAGT